MFLNIMTDDFFRVGRFVLRVIVNGFLRVGWVVLKLMADDFFHAGEVGGQNNEKQGGLNVHK